MKRYPNHQSLKTWLAVVALFLGLLVPAGSQAAPVSLRLEVTPKSGTQDEVFVLSVIISGDSQSSPPFLIGGNDWKLTLIGPRNEVRILNGQVESQLTYVYQLIPKRTGVLETPAAEVEVGGVKYSVAAIKVNVTEGRQDTQDSTQPVFFRQSVEKRRLFVGQQTVNTLELFSNVRVLHAQIMDLSYDDFYHQELGNEEHTQRVIDGKRYDITRLRRAIFPLRSGKLTIAGRKIQGQVPVNRQRRFPFGGGDPFGDDFFGSFFSTTEYQTKVFSSNALELDVEPLPAPPEENGATWSASPMLVGSVTMKVAMSTAPLAVGESRTMVVEVTSTANLNPLQAPPLDLGAAARVYAEEPEIKVVDDSNILVTKKIWRISIVPTSAGKVYIPELKLRYFDPERGEYRNAQNAPLSIVVSGNAFKPPQTQDTQISQASAGIPQPSGQASSSLPRWYEESWIGKWSRRVSLGMAFLIASLLALTVTFVIVIIRIRGRSKPFRKAKSDIEKSQSVDALYTAFERYLQLSFPSEDLMSLRAFVERGITDAGLKFGLHGILDEFDRLRFSPSASSSELDSLREKILSVLPAL